MRNNMFEDLPDDDPPAPVIAVSGGRHTNMTWKRMFGQATMTC